MPKWKEKSSDFLAAKLYYKMLSYKFKNDEAEDDYDNAFDTNEINKNNSKYNEDDDY